MMSLLSILKIIILTTGFAVWSVILIFLGCFLVFIIRSWSMWGRLSAAWKRANGDV